MGIWWGIFLVTWSATIFTLFYVRATMNKMFVPEVQHSTELLAEHSEMGIRKPLIENE